MLALALGCSSSPILFPQVPSIIPPFPLPVSPAKALVHPHTLFTPSLADKIGLPRGPALPGTGDQPGHGGTRNSVRENTGALPSPGATSLSTQTEQIRGFHCGSRGQQELKVFRSYISLYMVLSIVSAKFSQAKPGGDFSAVVWGQSHCTVTPPQSNADVRSHSPKSRMPVNPLFSHCPECEPGSLPLPALHDSSF